MRGETVRVDRLADTGRRDALNAPILEPRSSEVENVLVAPGGTSDVTDSTRPAGTRVAYTLHFPKTYDGGSLRGARISVRGEPARPVIGDPKPYTPELTPGDWNMPVQIADTEG